MIPDFSRMDEHQLTAFWGKYRYISVTPFAAHDLLYDEIPDLTKHQQRKICATLADYAINRSAALSCARRKTNGVHTYQQAMDLCIEKLPPEIQRKIPPTI